MFMVLRAFNRFAIESQAFAEEHRGRARLSRPQPLSARAYAIAASLITASFSLPIWLSLAAGTGLHAITMILALVCIWFGVWFLRRT